MKSVVFPPDLCVTTHVLADHFKVLAASDFRARKNMSEMALSIVLYSNLDKDFAVHDIFVETRFGIWHPTILHVLHKRERTQLEGLFMKAWYEGRFRKSSFRWRNEYVRYWKTHPKEYVPRLRSSAHRMFYKFQNNIEKAVKKSIHNPDQEVLDAVVTYKYLFRNRFHESGNEVASSVRKIPRRNTQVPREPEVMEGQNADEILRCMVTGAELAGSCDYQALVQMGTSLKVRRSVNAILEECMDIEDGEVSSLVFSNLPQH